MYCRKVIEESSQIQSDNSFEEESEDSSEQLFSEDNIQLKKEIQLEENDHCFNKTSLGCTRCEDGYYLEDYKCYKCEGDYYSTCYNETYALSCEKGYYLERNMTCVSLGELNISCNYILPNNKGCIKCNERYYREEIYCIPCISGCLDCFNDYECIKRLSTKGGFSHLSTIIFERLFFRS